MRPASGTAPLPLVDRGTLLRCIGPLALPLLLALAPSAAVPQDPPAHRIEGKWAGVAGPPQDRVPVAFEFKRNDKGELKAYYYAFVYNATALPGVLTPTTDGYEAKEWNLTLAVKGDTLVGTMFSAPFSLTRTKALPKVAPLPNLPAGPGPTWHTSLGGAIHAPAAIRDSMVLEMVYVQGTDGRLFRCAIWVALVATVA